MEEEYLLFWHFFKRIFWMKKPVDNHHTLPNQKENKPHTQKQNWD